MHSHGVQEASPEVPPEADPKTLDELLFDADRRAFARGELTMLTRVIERWAPLSERLRSEIEFAYLDGRRDERDHKSEDVGSLAHQEAVLRLIKTQLEELAQIGDVARAELGNPEGDDH